MFTKEEMEKLAALEAYAAEAPAIETWVPKMKSRWKYGITQADYDKLAVLEKLQEGRPELDEMPGWLANQRYVDPFPIR